MSIIETQGVSILWPEHRTVSAQQIRTWYADAVANDEATAGITDVDAMARELSNIGHITIGRDQ